MPAKITSHPMTMATAREEIIGNVIARIPKMIITTDNRIAVPDALFNPASSVVIVPSLPSSVTSQTFAITSTGHRQPDALHTTNPIYVPRGNLRTGKKYSPPGKHPSCGDCARIVLFVLHRCYARHPALIEGHPRYCYFREKAGKVGRLTPLPRRGLRPDIPPGPQW